MNPTLAETEEGLARFRREARAAASLRSTHVVQVLDYGVDDGIPYIAMKLLVGETLAGRLACVGRLDPEIHGRRPLAGGQGRDSRARGRHRASGPEAGEHLSGARGGGGSRQSPRFRRRQGRTGDHTAHPVDTRSGAMLGTPYYMSPEQAGGKRHVDHRSDVWALAVIAYECLLARRPFAADTLGGLVLAICSEPVPVPSAPGPVPDGFDAWFARATERDPDARFPSVKQAMQELRRVCGVEQGHHLVVVPIGKGEGTTTASSVPASSRRAPPDHTAAPAALTLRGSRRRRSVDCGSASAPPSLILGGRGLARSGLPRRRRSGRPAINHAASRRPAPCPRARGHSIARGQPTVRPLPWLTAGTQRQPSRVLPGPSSRVMLDRTKPSGKTRARVRPRPNDEHASPPARPPSNYEERVGF